MNYFPLYSSISFHRMIIQKNNWKSQPVQECKNKAGRDDPPCCYLNPCRRSHDSALQTQVTNRAVPNGVGQPPSRSLAIGWRSCHRANSFILKRANPRILSPSPHFSLNCSLFQVLWRIDFPIIIIVFSNFTGRDFSLFFLLFLSFFSYHSPASFLLGFSLPSHSFSYHRMNQTRLLWGFARPYKALFSSISHSPFSL